jgi:hypothetical protein
MDLNPSICVPTLELLSLGRTAKGLTALFDDLIASYT